MQRKRQIGLVEQQGADDLARVVCRQSAARTRESCAPLHDGRGHDRHPQRRRADQAQQLELAGAQVIGQAADRHQVFIEFVDFYAQALSLGRGVELAAHPVEQRDAQLEFAMLQNLGHRRLRNMQQLGCTGNRASLHDGVKNLDMAQAHGYRSMKKDVGDPDGSDNASQVGQQAVANGVPGALDVDRAKIQRHDIESRVRRAL